MFSLLAALLLWTAAPAGGNASQTVSLEDVRRHLEHFKLFNDCRPMQFVVESLDADARSVGLTEPAVSAAIESRLRSARLYTDDADQAFLAANIQVVGPAVIVTVSYKKYVVDSFGSLGFAETWSAGFVGSHGNDGAGVMSHLSRNLDEFLSAYLRVNESACDSRPGQPK